MRAMKKDKPMHESLERLLRYAQEATKSDPVPIKDTNDLWVAMDLSSAVITNWAKRGVSLDGARKAEQVFGCTVTHILDGTPMRPICAQDSISGAIYTIAQKLGRPTDLMKSIASSSLRQVAEHPDNAQMLAEAIEMLEKAIATKRQTALSGNAERA